MLCSISGEPTEEPVVSKVSGRVYEKRVVVAYIAERGTDPVTGEESTVDDLISIQGYTPVVKPRTGALTSVPALLGALQTEWDALALETFQLKQQLQQHKQELSSALYHHDAAVRVAARLQRERDEARQSLADLSASLGVAMPEPSSQQPASRAARGDDEQNGEPMDTTAAGGDEKLSAEWTSKVEAKSAELFKRRKALSKDQSVVAAAAAETENVQKFVQVAATKQLFANNQTLSVKEDQVLTGGAKSQFGVYSVPENDLTVSGKAGGIVTCGAWVPESADLFVLGLKTGGVELYSGTELIAKESPFGKHPIVDVAVLAAGIVAVAGGEVQQQVAFYTADSLEHLYTTDAFDAPIAAIAGHPDGELLAVAAGAKVHLLRVASNQVELTLPEAATAVQHLSISENGYFLAYSDSEAAVVYHLGKDTKVYETSAGGDVSFGGALGNCLLIDTGERLVVQRYEKSSKSFSHVVDLEKEGNVKRVGWTANASHAVAVTDKGKIVVYGPSADS